MKKQCYWGFTFGSVLSLLGFFVAGFGHGNYVLIGLSAAPFSLLGVLPALIIAPVWWTVAHGLLEVTSVRSRYFFIGIIAVHYVSAAVLLLWPDGMYADWERLQTLPPSLLIFFVLGIVVYVTGQALLWIQFARVGASR